MKQHPKKDRRVAREAGELLRIAREMRGLSQADAAAFVGIARTSLVKIEKGINAPTIDTFIAICRVYNVKPGAVLDPVLRRVQGDKQSARARCVK